MFKRVIVWAVISALAQVLNAQGPAPGNGPRNGPNRGGGRMHRTNVYQGPDHLHKPWVGSDTYDKNRARSHTIPSTQRAVGRHLDLYHSEEDRARALRNLDNARAQQESRIQANKAAIEYNRAAAESARRARDRRQSDEIQSRAAEQLRIRQDRLDEQARKYDQIVKNLKPCMAIENGVPCARKANPGIPFCYRHVGWQGEVRVEEPPAQPIEVVEAKPSVTPPLPVEPKQVNTKKSSADEIPYVGKITLAKMGFLGILLFAVAYFLGKHFGRRNG